MVDSLKKFLKRWLKEPANNQYWNIYGKTLKNPHLHVNPNSILFVCKGNICRSPYAEYASPRLLNGTAWQGLSVHSAGLIVKNSQKSPVDAVAAAQKLGIDMNFHTSRPLTHELVDGYDVILAMEAWQLQQMKRQYPKYSSKFFLLPLFDPIKYNNTQKFLQYNIEDPYGKTKDRYQESFQRIERCIKGLVKQSGRN